MNAYEKQVADYKRAVDRAHNEQLWVAEDHERTTADVRVFNVSHPESDSWYTVKLERGASQLSCNCEAGQRAVYCKHRALVHEFLLNERAAIARARASRRDAIASGLYDWWSGGADDRLLAAHGISG